VNEPRVQIRLCWLESGGGIGASDWQDDTPAVREAMRQQIEEGREMTPPISRWIDVKDAKPRWPTR
jgi:hypothetical protein